MKESTYSTIILQNYLYIPTININIFSSIKYYNISSYFFKETLYNLKNKPIAILNIKQSGFFLKVKSIKPPKAFLVTNKPIFKPYNYTLAPKR